MRFLLLVLIFTAFSGVISAGTVDKELLEYISKLSVNDMVPLVIRFESQGIEDLRLAIQYEPTKSQDNAIANFKKSLMDNAVKSQTALVNRTRNIRDITDIRHFWIDNMATLNCPAGLVPKMALVEGVERVYLRKQLHLIDPVAGNAHRDDPAPSNSEVVYGLERMNVTKVWKEFGLTGKGIKVGVVDSGLNKELGFTDGKLVEAKNFVGGIISDDITDNLGHGTHVSGTIIGGEVSGDLWEMMWGMFPSKVGTFNGRIGVAPGAKLYFAKVMESSGNFEDILAGLQWLADPDGNPFTNDGMDVINASLGASVSVPELREPLKNIQALGTFLCFAAGNSGKKVGSPADFPEIFAVGATDSNDSKASFSSIGPSEFDGKEWLKPQVCAPGVGIISYYKDKLFKMDGTSMAAPNTTGVIALLCQAVPGISHQMIRDTLMQTARDLGAVGPDNQTGWGRVDAYEAVRQLLQDKTPRMILKDRLSDLADSGKNGVRANLDMVELMKTSVANVVSAYNIDRNTLKDEAEDILPTSMQTLISSIWFEAMAMNYGENL